MKNRIVLTGICGILFSVIGCNRDALNPDTGSSDAREIRKTVKAGMSDCGSLNAVLTRTGIEYHESSPAKPDTHKVKWSEMDRVYSYSESGVYMYCDLKTTGVNPNLDLSNPYEAKVEVIYREGDKWYNAYVKGKSIGDYIGRRTQYKITFNKGIPYLQTGRFEDTHLAVTTAYPLTLDDIWFTNMQSFLRLKTIGNEKDNPGDPIGKGTIGNREIAYITLRNLVNEVDGRSDDKKEFMAGNVELDIEVENAWKYNLLKRTGETDMLKDSMITVNPPEGKFMNNKEYYVAVPVRTYLRGIQIDFYDASGNRLSYVKTPRVVLNYNQIYDCDDILQYVIFLCTKLDLYYDEDNDSATPTINCVTSTGVDIEEGHIGKLIPKFDPETVTDKTLIWDSSDTTVVKVASDGTITARSSTIGGGKCKIRATTATVLADGTRLYCEIEVRVKGKKDSGAGKYTPSTYSGGFAPDIE